MNTVDTGITNSKPLTISFRSRLGADLVKNRQLYLMIIPVIAFYVIFCYLPMYGTLIAFQNYNPSKGFLESQWVGLSNFKDFFQSYYFVRILKNTLIISISSIVCGFPIPIILALLINELKNRIYARTVQTLTYLPYFLSLVVICGIIKDFTSSTGLISSLLGYLGVKPSNLLDNPRLFVPIYVISDIWQQAGWGSIIYLAAISGIDQQLYEAAEIDGAGHIRKIWNVTIPGIMPTIVILLILRVGNIMNVGFDKILLLYSPLIYDTSDVISTFVYRKGMLDFNYSYSAAVGLFNSVVNLALVYSSNWFSRKVSENSLF